MEETTRAKLYNTAKGFGCLFWAILLWAAGALCLEKTSLGWKPLQLVSIAYLLPLFEGFMALRDAEPLRCRRGLLRFSTFLAIKGNEADARMASMSSFKSLIRRNSGCPVTMLVTTA